jgi:hypothetical protein
MSNLELAVFGFGLLTIGFVGGYTYGMVVAVRWVKQKIGR